MVWRLIEEVFFLTSLDKVKHKLKLMVANSLSSVACRERVESSRKSGMREDTGVFLEDQLLQSMMHNIL